MLRLILLLFALSKADGKCARMGHPMRAEGAKRCVVLC